MVFGIFGEFTEFTVKTPRPVSESRIALILDEMIDNRRRKYRPLKLKSGVTVQLGEHVLENNPDILRDLEHDTSACLSVLPASVKRLVQRTTIWLNDTYSYGKISEPKIVRHSTTHHFAGWLEQVRDNPLKAESIEIYSVAEYQRMRAHYNGCGLLLHELVHILHQKVLPGGLANSDVFEIWRIAQEGGKYNRVLRRDWAGRTEETDMAYGLINHKEFFADMSVSYLADGYCEFDCKGSTQMAKCSPPFLSQDVIQRVREETKSHECCVCQALARTGKLGPNFTILPFCAKFFPFTRGQFKLYDPKAFNVFARLWAYIEDWVDPESCGLKVI